MGSAGKTEALCRNAHAFQDLYAPRYVDTVGAALSWTRMDGKLSQLWVSEHIGYKLRWKGELLRKRMGNCNKMTQLCERTASQDLPRKRHDKGWATRSSQGPNSGNEKEGKVDNPRQN